jgi:hypothetical protein
MGGVCEPDNCPWPHHQIVAADQRKMERVGSIELPSLAKLLVEKLQCLWPCWICC